MIPYLAEVLRGIERRILALLHHGWSRVVVVTDHGWLLLPGGLPKVELPEHLTDLRKGRCARVKATSHVTLQKVPWHWDPTVRIAVAPGIGCFEAGNEYEHGGLSPQECIVPLLTVTRNGEAGLAPLAIVNVTWKRMRCQVESTGTSPAMTVDIRTKAGDPVSSLAAAPKPVGADGSASLVVPDEDREGDAALVVVLGEDGTVLAQALTTVGG